MIWKLYKEIKNLIYQKEGASNLDQSTVEIIYIVLFILSGVLFVVSIFMFVILDIKDVINFLSGRDERKDISKIRDDVLAAQKK